MKKYNLNTPEGTRDLVFEECIARREIEAELMKLFRENGFHEVITPMVEFCDFFSDYFPMESMYTLPNSEGRLMTIRPDSTLPIIRLSQTRLKNEPRPLKLCYNQTIYRAKTKESGRDTEIKQCGIEIIGGEYDAQAIHLATEALKLISVNYNTEYLFEIGDSNLFNKLVEKYNIDNDKSEKIRQLIETKNIPGLLCMGDIPKIFVELPKLFGGLEIFDKLLDLSDNDLYTTEIVALMKEIWEGDEHVVVDFSLTNKRNCGYYTGLLFNGYIGGYGKPILSGGSYKVNGVDADGFAVNVGAIAELFLKGGSNAR